MRGVSARSMDAVLDAAEGAAGTDDGLNFELGDGLFAVVTLLDSAPALRSALTDPSTSEEARSRLVQSLVSDQISAGAASVVDTAVRQRWASRRDLTDALETAGIGAHVAGDSDIDRIENELFEIGQVVHSEPELRASLSDRRVAFESKVNLVQQLFGSQVSRSAMALVTQALHARTGSFEKSLAAFAETAANRTGMRLAQVRAAHRISDSERGRLAETLSQQFGSRLHLNIVVDPAVIGGLKVSVGSQVFDGTMSSRLEAARRRLAG